jgi:hypothetical protein
MKVAYSPLGVDTNISRSKYSTWETFFAATAKIRLRYRARSENDGSRMGGSPSHSTRA